MESATRINGKLILTNPLIIYFWTEILLGTDLVQPSTFNIWISGNSNLMQWPGGLLMDWEPLPKTNYSEQLAKTMVKEWMKP